MSSVPPRCIPRIKAETESIKGPNELKPSIFVGCSGWRYWKWRDAFYAGVPQNDWFEHYLKHTSTPSKSTRPFTSGRRSRAFILAASARKKQVRLCLQGQRAHKKFKGTKTLVKDFGMITDILGDRMGCFPFQLPPIVTPRPASTTSSANLIRRAATPSNSGTQAGRMMRFTKTFAKPGSSSAPAVERPCLTSLSGQPTRFTSGCMVQAMVSARLLE